MNSTVAIEAGPGTVACLRTQPHALGRLICFAHAGGGPGSYRGWPAVLAPEVEVWSATLPGRAMLSDEPFMRSWEPLVRNFADRLDPGEGEGPPVLLGHSLGALMAFEVARELERRGAAARHVFVSGCRPPHRVLPDAALPASDDELVGYVDQRYGAVPAAVRAEPELLKRFVPILRADLELAAAYAWSPGDRLTCPITALAGRADRTAPAHEVAHWEAQTSGPFEHSVLPGAHFFLHSELRSVAARIRRAFRATPS
jgi:medium-chain acyl-[acyl-carrier-protein] hydrolase